MEVFGFETITQPDGFILSGKRNGSVYILDVTDFNDPVVYNIGQDPSDELEWFYHEVTWKDVDLDGDLDAITCRMSLGEGSFLKKCIFSLLIKTVGTLFALKQKKMHMHIRN